MSELTGLEYLTQIQNGILPLAPMHELVNLKLTKVEYGSVEFEFTPSQSHINLQGGVHGGLYATVLDTITGGAGHTTIDQGFKIVTIDLDTKMLRPLQVAKTYKGIGKLINAGREIVVTEGRIEDENGKLYAYGNAILKKINLSEK